MMPTVDPAIADLLKELQNQSRELAAIRDGINSQGGWSGFALAHFTDFVVIFLADVFAAVVVLVTFESWKERDQLHTERAQRVLGKISPHMRPLIQFLSSKTTNATHVAYGTPWGRDSQMWRDFSDPCLLEGSIDWSYPRGPELAKALSALKQAMSNAGGTIGSGPQSQAVGVLAEAQKVEDIRLL